MRISSTAARLASAGRKGDSNAGVAARAAFISQFDAATPGRTSYRIAPGEVVLFLRGRSERRAPASGTKQPRWIRRWHRFGRRPGNPAVWQRPWPPGSTTPRAVGPSKSASRSAMLPLVPSPAATMPIGAAAAPFRSAPGFSLTHRPRTLMRLNVSKGTITALCSTKARG
jgi:hypothetical protein